MKFIFYFLSSFILTFLLSFFPHNSHSSTMENPQGPTLNVLGTKLEACCFEPRTGWYRDGFCNTDARDHGVHVVCAVMTEEFLQHTSQCGNDLVTPRPEYGFPGLKPGDKWCLCVSRWKEAMLVGVAPPVVLESCHAKTLETVTLEELQAYELTEK